MSSLIIYEFLIFNGKEKLLFYEDYKKLNPGTQYEILNNLDKTQTHRIENISGISEATKSLVEKLSPTPIMTFKYFTTNRYKYNIFEMQTGLKFILITGVDNYDYFDALSCIYTDAYVEYITKNILSRKEDIIENTDFREKVKEILKGL